LAEAFPQSTEAFLNVHGRDAAVSEHHSRERVLADRPQTVDSKRRDVRVVEGARLEIALTACDGVLQIFITVADPES
jgi:hypothetical protein